MKVEILNDGPTYVEIKAPVGDRIEVMRVMKDAMGPMGVVLAMAKEIEELREALELDQDDLREALHELENLKRDCERGFTIVLEKMADRGQRVFE